MGRLIEVDIDKLKELLNENKIELTNNIISIVREYYIPKADYETRLKADMEAILTELHKEIKKVPKYYMAHDAICVSRKAEEYFYDINNLIQQKINSLEENADGRD